MNIRHAPMAALMLALALVGSTSRADVPPPDASGCYGKKAGDSCLTDAQKSGTCAENTCSKGGPDGGYQYACLICRESTDDSSGCSVPGSRAPWGAVSLIVLGLGSALFFTRRRRG
ncbi:MAG: hypothetical protein HY898_32230 [Deltaproteobacteria bacterium]|nr:hypothetical protein [Deltaproteobacteria bacterium]